jgi:hypothetical protein
MVAAVGGPKQFQAGHGGALANFIAHRQQPFRRWEVVGLVGEGQVVRAQPLLQSSEAEPSPFNAEGGEQLGQGDAVLNRHRVAAVQHHRDLGAGQH